MASWNVASFILIIPVLWLGLMALRRHPRPAHGNLLRVAIGLLWVALLFLVVVPFSLPAPQLAPAPFAALPEPAVEIEATAIPATATPILDSPEAAPTAPPVEEMPTATPTEEALPLPTPPAPPPPPGPSSMADGGERESMEVRGIHGSIVEGAFYSQALDREMAYQVYLPPSYDGSLRPYPVLYLLHGRGSNRTQWFMSGFTDVADQGILDGTVAPMLIVFPEGAFGYWTNHANNGPRWGDYVAKDLVAHVDATYRTVRRPSARAIGGISMGAWGALHHAFSAPDVYGVVGAHSPALRPDDGTLAFLGRGAEFSGKDPLSLARTLPANSRLRIRIDTGQDDPWVARATLLHNTLTERGIAHAWQVTPGGHNWDYWHALLEEYLRFYTRALTR